MRKNDRYKVSMTGESRLLKAVHRFQDMLINLILPCQE